MMKRIGRSVALPLAGAFAMGALVPQCDSLTESDFEQVNVSGFDIVDDAADSNDYAYSMEYFHADSSGKGHLYVGTGNNVAGLIGYYVGTLVEGGEILDAPVRPPEIRRYRPDLGPKEWETVLDYRDIEPSSEYRTLGFRFMTVLEAADGDGGRGNFLYAATQGEDSVLWRSRTGNPGDWQSVFTFDELGGSIRWIEQFQNRIYLAIAYDSFGDVPPPGELWVSDDGLAFHPIMQDGFGDPNNRGVQAIISFNDWLYAGTKNDVDGFDVWKIRPTAADPEQYDMIRVVSGGGPSAHNENAGMPIVFQDKLYFGTQLYIGGVNPTSGNAFEGCDIIRIHPDDSWDTIVGPNSLSGYESGFNHFTNAYLWWMEEYDGWLYAGTFDQATLLASLLDNLDGVLAFFEREGNKDAIDTVAWILDQLFDIEDYHELTHAGADIFKSPNGIDWYPVTRDGFDQPTNYGWRTMKACPDGYLYIGSANPTTGTQIWRGKVPDIRQSK